MGYKPVVEVDFSRIFQSGHLKILCEILIHGLGILPEPMLGAQKFTKGRCRTPAGIENND